MSHWLKQCFTIEVAACRLQRCIAWFPYDRNSRRRVAEAGSGSHRDSCVKWKNFMSDFSDVADQTVRGRIERVEMTLKPGFHMIVNIDRFHMSSTDRGQVADV